MDNMTSTVNEDYMLQIVTIEGYGFASLQILGEIKVFDYLGIYTL